MKFTQKSRFKYADHTSFYSLGACPRASSFKSLSSSFLINKTRGLNCLTTQLPNHKEGRRESASNTECESDISGSSLLYQPNHPCSEKPHPNPPQPLQFQVRYSWAPLPLQPSNQPHHHQEHIIYQTGKKLWK